MKKTICLLVSFLTLLSYHSVINGQEVVRKSYAYFSLEPEIVTNYLGSSARKLGFVRVSIELMLENPDFREDIRRSCLEKLQELMLKETGSKMIKDVIFTKYLYFQS
jgi:flagellar FliL protein